MSKITVKDAIKLTAELLEMQESVHAYLDGRDMQGEADVENLLRCFNLVENELALDYFPLLAEEKLRTETGAVYFGELRFAPVRITKVTDGWGNDCPYRLFPDYLKTQAGEITVQYSYLPGEKGLEDTSDFSLFVSVRLFAYGMASEYALSCGRFEEASVWDKKYKDAICAVYKGRPCKKMNARRWV